MLGKNKNLILIVVVLIVGFFAYQTYFVTDKSNDLLTVTGPASVKILGQDIIRNLNKIDALQLDATVLDHPVMKNLRDFSGEVDDQESGRDNPFLPYTSPVKSSKTSQTEGGGEVGAESSGADTSETGVADSSENTNDGVESTQLNELQ
jgi:hypothetical protein